MNNKPVPGEGPLWVYPDVDGDWVDKIIQEFHIHPATAHVLAARRFKNIEQIHEFLYAKLPDLHDPDLFNDMNKAIVRIFQALKAHENILIYGDNDVDGITATALLVDFFEGIGAKAFYYISNRTSLNQSLMLDALNFATKNQCTLLITVDCGITALAEIEEAVKRSIDVIVTDHHEPTAPLPHCVATLNPKLINSTYPNRDLTGVGVAFKLAHEITNHLELNDDINHPKIELKKYLDLVILGTVADMGALKDENRILVRYGLKQLRKTKRIGLVKLCLSCDVKINEITPLEIASKLAPRLNSLGRIADPKKGVEILLCRDSSTAETLAKELEQYNQERQKIERKDSEDIDEYLKTHSELFLDKMLFLYSNKWHPGIIPIIAARIAKQYNRPTVLIALDKGIGKGSLRTISEFPLLPILKENAHLLLNFGGHDYAAGFTIEEKNIALFKDNFIRSANESLKEQDLRAKLYLDAKISFRDLSFDFMESLNLLEPFGNENPAPIFYCNVKQIWPPKVIGKSHLKLYLKQNDRTLEGILFSASHRRTELLKKNLTLRIAFTPLINTFLNKTSIQLQIKDFHIIEK